MSTTFEQTAPGNPDTNVARWLLPLTPTFEPNFQLVGGKAAGLQRLLQSGFRVPPAYIVTTWAFREVLQHALNNASSPEEMRDIVLSIDLPAPLVAAIRAAHSARFGDSPVAVRSSATSEDSDRHSFAGQLETVLNVRTEQALFDAIRRVWASLFNRNNLLYRGRLRLDSAPTFMGVIVQQMLRPRSAGVLFTADPMGQEENRIIISAAPGLGDAVVEGQSTETVYVERGTGRILHHDLPPDETPALTIPDVKQLYRVASRIRDTFHSPRDVEWALDDEGVALLQSRPVTTMLQPRTATVWSNVNVGEALPTVATPMTWSIIHDFSRLGFENAFGALGLRVPEEYELVSSFHGRVFLNLTQFASMFSAIPFMRMRDILAVGGGGGADALDQHGFPHHSRRGFLARLPVTLVRMAMSQAAMPVIAPQWARRFRRHRDDFFASRLFTLSRSGLGRILRAIDRDFERTGVVMLACGSNFLSSYVLTRQLLRRWGGEVAAAKEAHLFSGLQGLASAEPGLELLDMARSVRDAEDLSHLLLTQPPLTVLKALEHSASGRALQQRLDLFLREYGNRAPLEAELSTPRWRETPEFLIEVIRNHLSAPYLPSRKELERERVKVRRETTELIRQYFRTGLGFVFRRILSHTQRNSRLREQLRSSVTDTLSMYRHFFLEVGRRLVKEEVLARPRDIFFLTRGEVEDYIRGEQIEHFGLVAAIRRAEYETFKDVPGPPDTFVLDGQGHIAQTHEDLPADCPYLQGLPASPGRVTGPARVIHQLTTKAELRPGEILVAPFTDVGWTPLFLLASGVVTDIGGPLSHSAVVAREYGVPAVVNVKEGTRHIKDGDVITIDGDTGRVFLAR